jgi:hypothetical protein
VKREDREAVKVVATTEEPDHEHSPLLCRGYRRSTETPPCPTNRSAAVNQPTWLPCGCCGVDTLCARAHPASEKSMRYWDVVVPASSPDDACELLCPVALSNPPDAANPPLTV